MSLQQYIRFEEIDIDKIQSEEDLEEVKKIARDSIIIKEISNDLNTLIGDQGEQLTQIEDEIETAIEHTQQANDQLEKARRAFFRSKLCKFTIIGIVVGAILGLLIGIILAETAHTDLLGSCIVGLIVGAIIGGVLSFSLVKCKLKK